MALDSTRKKVTAAIIAVVVVLAGVGAYVALQPTTQDKANTAAITIGDLAARDANGEEVTEEARAVVAALEEDTGCAVTGITGGLLPTNEAELTAFQDKLEADAEAYTEANPGTVIGLDEEGVFGSAILLDCSTE